MAQPDAVSDPYAEIVDDILATTKPKDMLKRDSDAIVARLVEELKKKNPVPEGASEEPLFSQARSMYWDWEELQRKKERTGKEEYEDTCPTAIGG